MSEECDICGKRVLDDQDALLCDKCNNWKHRTCMSISQKTYMQISKSKEQWYCGSCKNDSRKQQTKEYTINDVMAKLEEMNEKYNNLFTKFEEQAKINKDLQSELTDIKKQLNKREQKELRNNMIIHGIQYKQDESLPEIIRKIGQNLEVPTGKFTAYRLKQGEKGGPIKVVFEDENTKKDILKSKKKFTLQTKDLGYRTNNKVYLSHDLTKTNLELFKLARTFKTDMHYKFLWINNGNILLRKDETAKIVLVENKEQLKN